MYRFLENTAGLLNSEAGAETARLVDQHQWLTLYTGGLLPEEPDLSATHDVLDLACGPGGWSLDVAFSYPHLNVVGVDRACPVIRYAQAYAQIRRIKNVSFRAMNIVEPLNFPDNSFDLVNARFLYGFVPRAAWLPLLKECLRITRPQGILRLCEAEWGTTTAPAFQQIGRLIAQALWRSGYGFLANDEQWAITSLLPSLLRSAGYFSVQHQAHAIDFSSHMPANGSLLNDLTTFCKLTQFFVCHWTRCTPEEYERLYQQAITEVCDSSFCGVRYILTAWGYKSNAVAS